MRIIGFVLMIILCVAWGSLMTYLLPEPDQTFPRLVLCVVGGGLIGHIMFNIFSDH